MSSLKRNSSTRAPGVVVVVSMFTRHNPTKALAGMWTYTQIHFCLNSLRDRIIEFRMIILGKWCWIPPADGDAYPTFAGPGWIRAESCGKAKPLWFPWSPEDSGLKIKIISTVISDYPFRNSLYNIPKVNDALKMSRRGSKLRSFMRTAKKKGWPRRRTVVDGAQDER
jgi:hypothetical protein